MSGSRGRRNSLRSLTLFKRIGFRGPPASTPPPHRGIAIAVCLVLSALLWFTFAIRRTSSITLSLPTRVANLASDEALASPPPAEIQYIVVGDGLSLLPLYYNPPTVTIDASADLVDFELKAPEFPSNVRVETASPRVFQPVRERRDSITVPLRLRLSVDHPNTHILTTPPMLVPDSVTVSGAASLIRSLSSWPVESFSIDDLRDTLSVDLALVDSLSGLVRLSVQKTRLVAVATEFTSGKRDIQVQLRGLPANRRLVLDPPSVNVEYRVSLADYKASIESDDFYATVAYSTIRGDTTGRVRPVVHLPKGLEIRDAAISPRTVRYYNYLVD